MRRTTSTFSSDIARGVSRGGGALAQIDLDLAYGGRVVAERARQELLTTGATVRRSVPRSRDDLTPQEVHIARLARDGMSNPDIGAQLFLSARTVEWHLRKVFAKLGISSRRELDRALSQRDRATPGT